MITRPIECERSSFSHWPRLLGPQTVHRDDVTFLSSRKAVQKSSPWIKNSFLNDDQWGKFGVAEGSCYLSMG